jgi:tRNA-dihydrouridine synthase B
MSIEIGPIKTRNRVLLAPLSGVTDAPFRRIASENSAGLVVSEMVASSELVKQRPDMVRRARGAGHIRPFVIQLAGREAHWMAEGARLAQDLGADIIDINMGCPAREVTGGLSGSALMRDPDHALALIEATVKAVSLPVTLKMRLGWDDASITAPHIARRAEEAGVRMITVHGRTRCQFYSGKANWRAIRAVRAAISIPLIANGDCQTAADARAMLEASGADGVMMGRAAYGRPWWPGVIAESLERGAGRSEPDLDEELRIVLRHINLIIENYGPVLGNKTARKHVGWTLMRLGERGLIEAATQAQWRSKLLTTADNAVVVDGLMHLYGIAQDRPRRAA